MVFHQGHTWRVEVQIRLWNYKRELENVREDESERDN